MTPISNRWVYGVYKCVYACESESQSTRQTAPKKRFSWSSKQNQRKEPNVTAHVAGNQFEERGEPPGMKSLSLSLPLSLSLSQTLVTARPRTNTKNSSKHSSIKLTTYSISYENMYHVIIVLYHHFEQDYCQQQRYYYHLYRF